MVEYKDLHWRGNRLYYGNLYTRVWLTKDKKFKDMYWFKWNFGERKISANFCKIDFAKDYARKLYVTYRNNDTERGPTEPAGEFK